MSAVCGGVLFSLSLTGLLQSEVGFLGDLERESSADKPVEDLGLFNGTSFCESGVTDFGVLTLSCPMRDFRDTELLVFLCMPGRLSPSS